MRAPVLRLRKEETPGRAQTLDDAMELLQAVHRNLEEATMLILGKRGLGRAHQRILYLIAKGPGQSVSDMLTRLQVTKQALNLPLNQLKDKGLVRARRQPGNGRRKQLYLTAEGVRLERLVAEAHRDKFVLAFRRVGAEGERHWRQVMANISNGDLTLAPLRTPPVRRSMRTWIKRRQELRARA
jgi:DNA-binding MarR family transcriptional regulator